MLTPQCDMNVPSTADEDARWSCMRTVQVCAPITVAWEVLCLRVCGEAPELPGV
jgi:hypothetical protein